LNRAQKVEFVEEIRERFLGASLVVLTDFKGSTVGEMDTVRRTGDALGATYRVAKNTLCKRAIAETDLDGLSPHLVGNTGVLFSGEDAIGAAKMLLDLMKENKNLVIRGGYFEGDILDEAGVKAIASLPSREELLSTLLRTIQEGPRQIMGVIQAPGRDLLYLLNNYASKLEEGG